MDCRGSLGLALCLLSGAAGCQHQVTTLSPTAGVTKPEATPDPSQIKKASILPAKDPPAAVLVSWGDFKAGEADARDISPDRQQEIRDAARLDYERALKSEPKNVAAYQGLARLQATQRNHARAIETYQIALQIAPKNAALWFEMGKSHNYQRNWGPAVECLNRAVQLDPDNRYYSNTLGVVLAQTGRYQESLNCFIRAGGEAVGYMRLAQTLQHLQQPELSRQYLAVALQKDPNLATTMVMKNEMKEPPPPSVQRASYQAPSVPQAPVTPVGSSGSMPRVIHLEAVDTNATTDISSTPQPFVVPPPPTVNLRYAQPGSE